MNRGEIRRRRSEAGKLSAELQIDGDLSDSVGRNSRIDDQTPIIEIAENIRLRQNQAVSTSQSNREKCRMSADRQAAGPRIDHSERPPQCHRRTCCLRRPHHAKTRSEQTHTTRQNPNERERIVRRRTFLVWPRTASRSGFPLEDSSFRPFAHNLTKCIPGSRSLASDLYAPSIPCAEARGRHPWRRLRWAGRGPR